MRVPSSMNLSELQNCFRDVHNALNQKMSVSGQGQKLYGASDAVSAGGLVTLAQLHRALKDLEAKLQPDEDTTNAEADDPSFSMYGAGTVGGDSGDIPWSTFTEGSLSSDQEWDDKAWDADTTPGKLTCARAGRWMYMFNIGLVGIGAVGSLTQVAALKIETSPGDGENDHAAWSVPAVVVGDTYHFTAMGVLDIIEGGTMRVEVDANLETLGGGQYVRAQLVDLPRV